MEGFIFAGILAVISIILLVFYLREKSEKEKAQAILELQQQSLIEDKANSERLKQEFLHHSKEAFQQANIELLKEHRKENEEARKKSLAEFRNNTEKLNEHFSEVYKKIHLLGQKVETVELIKNSLLTPHGAGFIAEITMNNIFKASGLQQGRDYELQYTVDSGQNTQRPDAVVFLPNNDILIVDSKTSTIFMELESELNDSNQNEVLNKLKQAMNRHLRSLASKDYQESVKTHINKSYNRNVAGIFTVMFLPTDPAWEKVRLADQAFNDNAFSKGIFPCGPSGLINILVHSRFGLMSQRRTEEFDVIINEIQKMMAQLGELYESARKVGSGIETAARNYNDFITRFNGKFLDTSRNLGDSIQLPAKFPQTNLESIDKQVKPAKPIEANEKLKELVG